MPIDENLASTLNLTVDAEDEDVSTALVALITSAVNDAAPQIPLADVYRLVTNYGVSSLLDPLNSLPHLIPSSDPSARDILSLIGECSPAKEVVMAVQESVERLETALDTYDEDELNEAQSKQMSLPAQLAVLIDLYSSAISRLKLRRKTASETIHPLLKELENTIALSVQICSQNEGRVLLDSSSHLVEKLIAWVKLVAGETDKEASVCYKVLNSFLSSVLASCSRCVRSSLAQRTFEKHFPRLTLRSVVEHGWEEGEKAVQNTIRVLELLGSTSEDFVKKPSISSLIILAHSPVDALENNRVLVSLGPVITASIQSNTNLEESIALLIKLLHLPHIRDELSPDVIAPIATILPPLASTHPDPLVRHQAFRTLSKLLSICPGGLRLQLLIDLAGGSDFPQMRVASVGLIKEAVMEALSSPGPSSDVFASPMLLKAIGPIIFRPSPPDLFSGSISLSDFQESQEPRRLVECLAFYYVLLQRDTSNVTGVRDKDVLLSVERGLLAPLRSTLDNWMNQTELLTDHIHDNISLVSLKMSLERVDTAVASLQ